VGRFTADIFIYKVENRNLKVVLSLRVKTCLIEINHNIIFLKVRLLNVSEEYNHWLSIFTGLDICEVKTKVSCIEWVEVVIYPH